MKKKYYKALSMVFSVYYIQTVTFNIVVHSSEKWSFAACDWANDFFHVRKASFAASHWLELICVRVFTTWLFREYVSVCI